MDKNYPMPWAFDKPNILKIIRVTFYSMLVLFLFDICDVFQTKIEFFKALTYYGVLILPIPLLIMEFKTNRSLSKPILRKGIPMLTIIALLYINPIRIIFNTATWKTQTVVLISEKMTDHKVEFQMKDVGALGYAKRTAEVIYFSKYFYIVWEKKYDTRNFIAHQWKRVNENVNEMGLK